MTDLRIRGDVDLPLPNPPNQNATRRDPVPGHAGLLLDKLSARLVLQEGVRKLDKTETLCRLFGCDIHERNGERTCLPRRHRTLDADAVKALKAAHERLDRLRVAPRGDACTFAATSPPATTSISTTSM